MKNRKHKPAPSVLRTAGICMTANIVTAFIVFLIAARILYSMKDPTGGLHMASCISFAVSALISGFISAKLIREKGHTAAAVSAAVFALLLLFISLSVTGGSLPLYNLVCFAAYAAAGTLGGILGKKREKRRRRAY